MGYYATVKGQIIINTRDEDLIHKTEKLMADAKLTVVNKSDWKTWDKTAFLIGKENIRYDEDEIKGMLNSLCANVQVSNTSVLEFEGQEDDRWRFAIEDGIWFEQEGETVYKNADEPSYEELLLMYRNMKDTFRSYVLNDLEGSDIGYIRDALDTAGCDTKMLEELGLGNLDANRDEIERD